MTQNYVQNETIAAYFEDHQSAQRALDQLRDAGFTSAHLGVAHRGLGGTAQGKDRNEPGEHEGVWDKIKNFFEGGAEPYAEEPTRGDMATREITTTGQTGDYGYGQGYGYGQDDLQGSLTGMAVPEDRAHYLSSRFRSGRNGAIVTVRAGDRVTEAERILRDNGADLGDTAGGYTSSNTAAYATDQGNYAQAQNPPVGGYPGESQAAYGRENAGEQIAQDRFEGQGQGTPDQLQDLQNIQLLGEVLRVHKDRIARGEVRIRKDVITETQTVQVPVTREELVVERMQVGGQAQPQGAIGEAQEIRIPLTEETASVDKGTVVRDQIAVGKRPVTEVRDLSGEVRHEELIVEDETRKSA